MDSAPSSRVFFELKANLCNGHPYSMSSLKFNHETGDQ